MNSCKNTYGEAKFKENETFINVNASFIAGCLGAALTNPLECITVNK